MTSNDLKTRIRAHLATANEATAKQIAKAVGHADYPTVVISALSEMRTDAEVECEKKAGKGNELWYWLTSIEAIQANAVDALTKSGTAIDAEPVVRENRTTESAPAKSVIIEGLNAQIDSLTDKLALAEKQRDSHFAEAEAANQKIAELEAMLSACAESSAADMKMIANLEYDIQCQVRRASSAESSLKNIMTERNVLQTLVNGWESMIKELINENTIHGAANALHAMKQQIADFNTALDTSARIIQTMAEEQAQPQQAGDLPLPAGYLVASPNKPLRKFSKERNAMTAAAAAARQSGLAEIYAIHPHMKAVRGVEFKEAA